MEDEKLIRRIRSGDSEALDELIRKYYGDIYTYCCRRLGRKPDAEDVTQEVFLHFCRYFDSYAHRGKCRNFLFTIAHNLCVDALRRKAPVSLEEKDAEDLPCSDGAQERLEASDSVRAALNALPEEQKEAVVLRFYHGFKIKEIARITGSGLSLTKYRLYQGLKVLSGLLSKEDWL